MNIPEIKSPNTDQYHLRLPGTLKRKLQEIAVTEQRTLNGQIVFLLEKAANENADIRTPEENGNGHE